MKTAGVLLTKKEARKILEDLADRLENTKSLYNPGNKKTIKVEDYTREFSRRIRRHEGVLSSQIPEIVNSSDWRIPRMGLGIYYWMPEFRALKGKTLFRPKIRRDGKERVVVGVIPTISIFLGGWKARTNVILREDEVEILEITKVEKILNRRVFGRGSR